MKNSYGLSLVGFRADLVIKIFTTNVEIVESVALITTRNKESEDAVKNVIRFLDMINVEHEVFYLVDIFNFFEAYFLTERIYSKMGKPVWINATAGPGVAISALAISALQNNIPLVSYDIHTEKSVVTDTRKLELLRKYHRRYSWLLNSLNQSSKTLSDLSREFDLSKSTLSRHLKDLRELGLVSTEGNGRGLSKMVFKVTNLGKL